MQKTPNFPKSHRYTLGSRIESLFLDMLETVTDAVYCKQKSSALHTLDRQLEKLRILTRLCVDLRVLSFDQQEFAVKEMESIGRQIGGWKKSLARAAETP